MNENAAELQCEVPRCPNPAGYGLRVCERHLREPATPTDHAEALAYLRERLARYDRFWIEPDRAAAIGREAESEAPQATFRDIALDDYVSPHGGLSSSGCGAASDVETR